MAEVQNRVREKFKVRENFGPGNEFSDVTKGMIRIIVFVKWIKTIKKHVYHFFLVDAILLS